MASDKIVCPKCGFPVRRVGQHACERFRQVIELWNRPECLTLSEMGRRAGVSRERIRQIVLLAGLSKHITVERKGRCSSCGCRATPHHLASECHRAQQVVKLYQDAQFHSLAEIGRQVRLSPEQVSAIARRAGLDRRAMATQAYWESLKTPCSRCGLLVTPGYHSPQVCRRSVQIMGIYKRRAKLSQAAIAKRFGTSTSAVRKVLRRAALAGLATSSGEGDIVRHLP